MQQWHTCKKQQYAPILFQKEQPTPCSSNKHSATQYASRLWNPRVTLCKDACYWKLSGVRQYSAYSLRNCLYQIIVILPSSFESKLCKDLPLHLCLSYISKILFSLFTLANHIPWRKKYTFLIVQFSLSAEKVCHSRGEFHIKLFLTHLILFREAEAK
jgi:hypothetical protein